MATTKTREHNQVELEEGAMSFLEHRDELRSRLVRVAMFVAVAFVVCWIFSSQIYNFLQVPVSAAMIAGHQEENINLKGQGGNFGPLTDYIGKEVSFVFVGEARIDRVNVPTGTTIKVR